MKLMGYEIRKLLCQKSLAVILIICAVLNLLLLEFQIREQSYTPQAYLTLMNDILDLEPQEARETVAEKKEELQDMIWESDVYTDEDLANYAPYTGDIWTEQTLLTDVYGELETVTGYQDYLDSVQEEASQMLGVSIFRKSSGFSIKNINKTAADFSEMYGVNPTIDVSRGVEIAAGQRATDFIMVLCLAAFCVFLIIEEKQTGLALLNATTAFGRQRLMLTKMLTMIAGTVLFMAILYAENFAFAAVNYGFGDLKRPIQSIASYQTCTLQISVGEYFVLFLLSKSVIYVILGFIFFAICLLGRKILSILLVTIAILGGSAALALLIAENSTVMALRFLNLFYFLQTDALLTVYKNVNLFGRPVSVQPLYALLMIVIGGGLLFVNVKSVRKTNILYMSDIKKLFAKRRVRQSVRSIDGFERLKLIRRNGVYLILILFAVIQIYRIWDYNYFERSDEIYYKSYMDYLSGPVTEETDSYVVQENDRYAQLQEELSSTDDLAKQSEIGQKLLPYEAWNRVVAEYERVVEVNEIEGLNLSMIFPTGYYMLMGDDRQGDMICDTLFGVLLCICLCYVFAVDAGCGMDRLIFTTPGGRKDTLRAKKKISFVIAIFPFVMVYGGDFFKIWLKIGMQEWNAPLQSLSNYAEIGLPLRIWQYVVLLYVIKLLGMFACLALIRLISYYCRDIFRTLLVSAMIFILPGLLGLLGVTAVDYITLLPLLTGNTILNGILGSGAVIYGVVYLAIAVVLIWFSGKCLNEKYRE